MAKQPLIVALSVALLGIAFAMGDSFGQRQIMRPMSRELDQVQAMLAANKIGEERRLRQFLKRECYEEASQQLDWDMELSISVANDLSKRGLDSATRALMDRAVPGLVGELATFSPKMPHIDSEIMCMHP